MGARTHPASVLPASTYRGSSRLIPRIIRKAQKPAAESVQNLCSAGGALSGWRGVGRKSLRVVSVSKPWRCERETVPR